MSEEKTIQEVYRDRNLLAAAISLMAYRLESSRTLHEYAGGWTEPDVDDADADEWAIVWAILEGKQVSWHVPRELVEPVDLPKRPHDYDGHTREEKNQRLEDFIESR
ncbi:hypothetical protein ACFOZ7_05670 [Natribaculum luteum]|uniref:Uncharacterized protein n=1 Tax=Natribaculum luteum TaxID=1586232 RepID=A0ABD5NXJ8_9EURY|nr:hypothetical protein [Natribaculum luteum]